MSRAFVISCAVAFFAIEAGVGCGGITDEQAREDPPSFCGSKCDSTSRDNSTSRDLWIQGRIVFSEGIPFGGLFLRLFPVSGGPSVKLAGTNANGRFAFFDIPGKPSDYWIGIYVGNHPKVIQRQIFLTDAHIGERLPDIVLDDDVTAKILFVGGHVLVNQQASPMQIDLVRIEDEKTIVTNFSNSNGAFAFFNIEGRPSDYKLVPFINSVPQEAYPLKGTKIGDTSISLTFEY